MSDASIKTEPYSITCFTSDGQVMKYRHVNRNIIKFWNDIESKNHCKIHHINIYKRIKGAKSVFYKQIKESDDIPPYVN